MIKTAMDKIPNLQSQYVTQFDVVPEFWQFLNGLRADDIITELVQNDLDADARKTSISFGKTQLICEGDGDPVEKKGWARLTYIRGAGDQVPRKRNRIGIKNHGLKTCFTISDDIIIRSDGKLLHQTLYKNGRDQPPLPGAFDSPVIDAESPMTGCRVEVPYRARDLVTKVGEPLLFPAPSSQKIDELFLNACREIPQRFLGVIRPKFRDQYTIELRHHRLGHTRFEFRCGRLRKSGRMQLFSRVCKVFGDQETKIPIVRERACFFALSLPSKVPKEIPSFYRASRGFLGEIAWSVNSRGTPVQTCGHLRYPITYPAKTTTARNWLGVHYSGPYVSDLERHGISESAKTLNSYITESCDAMLIKLLHKVLIPRFGPKALTLLVDPGAPNNERLLRMVEYILEAGSIPLLPRMLRTKKGNRRASKRSRKRMRFGPYKRRNGETARFVIPCFTWKPAKVSALLSELCPIEEEQIHPKTPEEIVGILTDGDCVGHCEDHVEFNEQDLIKRLRLAPDAYFEWPSDKAWRAELGNPDIAIKYLDVVNETYGTDAQLNSDAREKLKNKMFLPDSQGRATCFSELYLCRDLPTDLPNLTMPPILHPRVSLHPLFRRRNWRPPPYRIGDFLKNSDIANANEETRRAFWRWLCKNWRAVPQKNRSSLADLPIWPDRAGNLVSFDKLCQPKQSRSARILSTTLHLPSPQFLKLPLVKRKGRSRLRLRTHPSDNELSTYFDSRLKMFPVDRSLTGAERKEFHAFEEEVATLARDRMVAERLKMLFPDTLALNKRHCLLPCTELHRNSKDIRRIHLMGEDLIDRAKKALDKVISPREQPSVTAVLRALTDDPLRISALPYRLHAYLKAVRREEASTQGIARIPCIPVNGNLKSASELAFKSNKGDFWGSWKIQISGKGLSADVQELYRHVGVTGAEPKPISSLAFFEWLNGQNDRVVYRHLECIFRHLIHRGGVGAWWHENPNIPCVPVEVGDAIELVSWKAATNPRGRVFIPDFPELVATIRADSTNPSTLFAVVIHPKVRRPISNLLRVEGVRSLRRYAVRPIKVSGEEEREAPPELLAKLDEIRSARLARELRKRLAELDVGADLIRENWQNRLGRIRHLKLALSVLATYKVGRRHYSAIVSATFDENDGTLWVTDRGEDLETPFYEAIAGRVFVEDSPKWVAAALRQAVQTQFREKKWTSVDDQAESDGLDLPLQDEDAESVETDEPGETAQTHMDMEPDPSKNVPEPRPISTTDETSKGRPARSDGDRGRSSGGHPDVKYSPETEKIQIRELKENHYAWHCQLCLADRSPQELAPTGSYVELQENRHRLIEAQHADQKHAGGARHAGNILILCHFHHHRYGNAISRADITEALRRPTLTREITFASKSEGTISPKNVGGIVATVQIIPPGERVQFFFTKEHRDYWLKKASD